MQELLMHISRVKDLKTLKPLTFENGNYMLCATDCLAFALMMFAKVDKVKHPKGNFHCSLKDDGILYVEEKWQNAFNETFSGQKAYLYFVNKNDAVFNPSVPQFEYYSDQPVVKMVEIYDILSELKKQIKQNKLKINYFK